MTTEQELREVLAEFGCALEVRNNKRSDSIIMYPTRSKHIHKMVLTVGCRLGRITLRELLFYCLGHAEYALWNRKQWEPFL